VIGTLIGIVGAVYSASVAVHTVRDQLGLVAPMDARLHEIEDWRPEHERDHEQHVGEFGELTEQYEAHEAAHAGEHRDLRGIQAQLSWIICREIVKGNPDAACDPVAPLPPDGNEP
jgi:hypothetical protein